MLLSSSAVEKGSGVFPLRPNLDNSPGVCLETDTPLPTPPQPHHDLTEASLGHGCLWEDPCPSKQLKQLLPCLVQAFLSV